MKKNYLKRSYYRLDSILETIKIIFLGLFIKYPKIVSHKFFLYKTPPKSVIKFNFFGILFTNIWYIFIYFSKFKKLPFIIEDKINDKFSSSDFFNSGEITNPSFKVDKSTEINLEFYKYINESYQMSIEDDNLKYRNSEWWTECIQDFKKKIFDDNGNIIINNLENIFQLDFKAILFELSSPIKQNKNKISNFLSSLRIINQYHLLSDIIMDGVLRTISEPKIGNNKCVIYRGQRLSERLIRHGYYVSQIVKNTKFLNDPNQVFLDLGGGFGSLSRLLITINKTSKCILIEQPEVCLIAAYYLKKNFPKKKLLTYSDYRNLSDKSKFFENKDFDILILPSWCFSEIPNDYIDLSINTTSLGEVSKDYGKYFLDNIERTTKNYFYSNNKVNSVENIWDGFGHNQFDFKKNWFPIIYNFSYTWHLEFLGKKIN